MSALPVCTQSHPLRSAVGTQLYFLPGSKVSTLPYLGSSPATVPVASSASSAAIRSAHRIRRLRTLPEHDVETALELRVARMLERGERVVALEEHLAFEAHAPALLAPFADQRPAAEQVLLQGDLVVLGRLGCGGLGL